MNKPTTSFKSYLYWAVSILVAIAITLIGFDYISETWQTILILTALGTVAGWIVGTKWAESDINQKWLDAIETGKHPQFQPLVDEWEGKAYLRVKARQPKEVSYPKQDSTDPILPESKTALDRMGKTQKRFPSHPTPRGGKDAELLFGSKAEVKEWLDEGRTGETSIEELLPEKVSVQKKRNRKPRHRKRKAHE